MERERGQNVNFEWGGIRGYGKREGKVTFWHYYGILSR